MGLHMYRCSVFLQMYVQCGLSVRLFADHVTTVIPAKTAEPIDIPFGGQGRRQIKQSGVDSMGGVWGGVSPLNLGGRVSGYNLKLISTLHNDSPGKKWGGRVHPSPPCGNAPVGVLAGQTRGGPQLKKPRVNRSCIRAPAGKYC